MWDTVHDSKYNVYRYSHEAGEGAIYRYHELNKLIIFIISKKKKSSDKPSTSAGII